MRRLVVAVDCDDVLVDSTRFLVEEYNKLYHTHVTLENAHMPKNSEWGEIDENIVLARLTDLQMSEGYANTRPSESTIKAIHHLAQSHELHLITARHKKVENVTLKMIKRYFDNCFMSVEHVGRDRTKGQVTKEIRADVLVDDNIRYLISALESGLTLGGALHFGKYPWNRQQDLKEGIVNCENWDSVLSEVDRLARQ